MPVVSRLHRASSPEAHHRRMRRTRTTALPRRSWTTDGQRARRAVANPVDNLEVCIYVSFRCGSRCTETHVNARRTYLGTAGVGQHSSTHRLSWNEIGIEVCFEIRSVCPQRKRGTHGVWRRQHGTDSHKKTSAICGPAGHRVRIMDFCASRDEEIVVEVRTCACFRSGSLTLPVPAQQSLFCSPAAHCRPAVRKYLETGRTGFELRYALICSSCIPGGTHPAVAELDCHRGMFSSVCLQRKHGAHRVWRRQHDTGSRKTSAFGTRARQRAQSKLEVRSYESKGRYPGPGRGRIRAEVRTCYVRLESTSRRRIVLVSGVVCVRGVLSMWHAQLRVTPCLP